MCTGGSFMITATKLIHGHRCLQTGCHDSTNVEPLVRDFLAQQRHVRDQMIANYIKVCSGGLLMWTAVCHLELQVTDFCFEFIFFRLPTFIGTIFDLYHPLKPDMDLLLLIFLLRPLLSIPLCAWKPCWQQEVPTVPIDSSQMHLSVSDCRCMKRNQSHLDMVWLPLCCPRSVAGWNEEVSTFR